MNSYHMFSQFWVCFQLRSRRRQSPSHRTQRGPETHLLILSCLLQNQQSHPGTGSGKKQQGPLWIDGQKWKQTRWKKKNMAWWWPIALTGTRVFYQTWEIEPVWHNMKRTHNTFTPGWGRGVLGKLSTGVFFLYKLLQVLLTGVHQLVSLGWNTVLRYCKAILDINVWTLKDNVYIDPVWAQYGVTRSVIQQQYCKCEKKTIASYLESLFHGSSLHEIFLNITPAPLRS